MSDNSSEDEPSIEEILASIRQIISDDDEEEAAVAAEPEPEPPAPEPEPVAAEPPPPPPEPEPTPAPEPAGEQILELTEDMQEAAPARPKERIEIDMQDPAGEASAVSDENIIAGQTAAAALGSMAKIVGSMPVSRSGQFKDYNGVTLEDIVRDLLYPELKQWMDSYLPSLVERLVQAELERLTKRFQDLDR